jgi:surfactin synthase thioesterase subunit
VVELVMLPGLDGTGLLFRPLVATLSGVETKVVSYPNDKALSLDEHARATRRRFYCDSSVLAGTRRCRSSTSSARRSQPCRRFELERVDGPHFLLQTKPRERAQRISEFSVRIGV